MKAYHMLLIFNLLGLFGGTVMAEPGEVLLQEKIEPNRALKTLDLYSEEKSLGSGGTGLQRIMEGEVTVGMAVIDRAVRSRPEHGPIRWDYYSIYLPFTLHRLDGDRYYESAVFQVTLDDSTITAADLFPADITTETKVERTLSVTPEFKFSFKQTAEASVGAEAKTSINYITLAPLISAFGKGQRQFYWEHKGYREQPVLPGDKQAAVILRVPHGASRISAHLDYKAIVVEKVFGVLRKKNVKSGTFSVSWILPKPS